jgi:hypothetical protein
MSDNLAPVSSPQADLDSYKFDPESFRQSATIARDADVQYNDIKRQSASWGDAASEFIPAVASGAENFITAPARLIAELGGGNPDDFQSDRLFKTHTADFVRDTTEMVASVATAELGLGALGGAARAGQLGRVGQAAAAAADSIADYKAVKLFTWGKPKAVIGNALYELTAATRGEAMVFNWMQKANSPLLNNAVTRYLAGDDGESEFGRRLGRAVESIPLGFASELFLNKILGGVFKGVKARFNGSAELAQKSLGEVAEYARTYPKYMAWRDKVSSNVALINPEKFDAAMALYFFNGAKQGRSFETSLTAIKDFHIFDGTIPKELPPDIAQALGVEVGGLGARVKPYTLGPEPTPSPSTPISDANKIPLSPLPARPETPGENPITSITKNIGDNRAVPPTQPLNEALAQAENSTKVADTVAPVEDRLAARDAAVEEPKAPTQFPPNHDLVGSLEDGTRRIVPDDIEEQIARGMFWAVSKMEGIIGLSREADFATLQHELFHLHHTLFGLGTAADSALRTAIKAQGIEFGPNGEWTEPAFEAAAAMHSRYWLDGQAPSDELKSYFAKVQSWMQESYNRTDGIIDLAGNVSPEVRSAFDAMLNGTNLAEAAGAIPETIKGLSARVNKVVRGLAAARSPKIPQAILTDAEVALTDSVKNGQTLTQAMADATSTINLSRMGLPGETKNLAALAEQALEKFYEKTGMLDTMSHEQTVQVARGLLKNVNSSEDALALVKNHARDVRELAAQDVAVRSIHAKALAETQDVIQRSLTDPSLSGAVSESVGRLAEITKFVKQTTTDIARALESKKILSDPNLTKFDEATAMLLRLQNANAEDNLVLRRQILRALATVDKDPIDLLSAFEQKVSGYAGKSLNSYLEFWINGLLGGAKTHVINSVGQAVNTGIMPLYRIIGGAVSGDGEAVKSASRLYMNVMSQVAEMFDVVNKGLKVDPESALGRAVQSTLKEQPILDSVTKIDGPRFAISAENWGLTEGTTTALAMDYLGKTIRLPTRFLTGADEFWKVLNYNAFIREEGFKDAMERGLQPGSQEFGDYVARFVKDAFDNKGGALDQRALEYAKKAVFQGQFPQGSFMKDFSNLVAKHPALRLITPFIRVPTNIAKNFGELTPMLNLAFTDFRNAFLGRVADRDLVYEARGKMAVGAVAWMLATGMALSGKITGGGPKDPELRNQMLASGWRPYSIVIPDADGKPQYIEYLRLEPFATIASLAANFNDVAKNSDDQTIDTVAMGLTTALAKNLASKTFLTGLSETMNVLTNPDPSAMKFIQNRLASNVPNEIGQFAPDEYLREARTLMDAVIRRIPGYAEGLPAKRDVLGQKVPTTAGLSPLGAGGAVANIASPFRYSKDSGDPVRSELANIGVGFSPPPKSMGPVDLTTIKNDSGQDAYDRYQELAGTVKVNGRNLMEDLKQLISSDRYKSMPDPATLPEDIRSSSGRAQMIQSIIGLHRQVAQRQLLKEFPEITKTQQVIHQQRIDSRRPTSPVIQRLLAAQ